jgi:hypothetical protein
MDQIVLNISSVKSFLKDRRRWYYEWVLDRVPRKGQKALTFGKVLHLVFEEHFKAKVSMAEAIDLVIKGQRVIALATKDESEKADIIAAIEELEGYREPLSMWTDQYPIDKTLAVEEAYEFPHPKDERIIIRMRPDREAVIFGKVFHVQNRSLAAGKNIGLYTELMQRDMHEMGYGFGLRLKHPEYEYGGTLFNLLRKLKYRSKPTKAEPDGKILHPVSEMMGQYMIPAHPEQIVSAMNDLQWVAYEMERTVDGIKNGNWPASSRDMDAGMFGNSKDAYFGVLMGTEDIYDDTLFKPREQMYATEVNNEVE